MSAPNSAAPVSSGRRGGNERELQRSPGVGNLPAQVQEAANIAGVASSSSSWNSSSEWLTSHQHSSCHWEHSCQQGQESQKSPPKQAHIIGTLSAQKQSCSGLLGKPWSSLGFGFFIWLQCIGLDDFQGPSQLGMLPGE